MAWITGMHVQSWTEFYILITNCPNIATSFVGMKDVAMLAKDVAMLGRTLLHVKSLIATEKIESNTIDIVLIQLTQMRDL